MSTAQRPVPRALPDAPHGTLRGYQMGCRCLFCGSSATAAGTAEVGTR